MSLFPPSFLYIAAVTLLAAALSPVACHRAPLEHYTQQIVDATIPEPLSWWYYVIHVAPSTLNPELVGNFAISGGRAEGNEVLILTDAEFWSWYMVGNTDYVEYRSGLLVADSFDVPLSDTGNHYLVYDFRSCYVGENLTTTVRFSYDIQP